MISRRNIRIKVLQTVYSLESHDPQHTLPPPADNDLLPLANEILQQHFDRSRQLLVYLIHTITQVALYVESYAQQRASKLLPSQDDLRINTKMAGNELVIKILDMASWKKAIKADRPAALTDMDVIRKLFLDLKDTDPYQQYIHTPGHTLAADKTILEHLFRDVMLTNELFTAHLAELFINWDDDADMMVLLVANFLQKMQGYDFSELISKEKREFGFSLLRATLEKKEVTMEYIRPRLKNWDPERIAMLDMILMRMGVCEFLFFETIPPKVTINEYIDLAKEYSTPQSGHFVNGILDNIHKDLVNENKMHKIAFKPGRSK